MPAVALPELIVPGELYVPDGLEAPLTLATASMPNGDNSALITEMAGTENFQARQDSIGAGTGGRAPHLLTDAACALSFWIRRNQNFDSGSASIPAATVTPTALTAQHRIVMGVADPTYTGFASPGNRVLSWAFVTYSTTQIMFLMNGRFVTTNEFWATASPQFLALDEWHLIVVNREAATFTTAPTSGRFWIYLNGALSAPSQGSPWSLYPNPTTPQRFAIGDPTMNGRTAGGAAGGPAWNIAKLAFHDRQLTGAEILAMYESMRYGPPSP